MTLASLAQDVGRGLVAGFLGTVAITVSSTVEQKLRGRPPSTAPADAAAKVLGIERFEDEGAHQRFSLLVHWGYGTGWGAVRALLGSAGLRPGRATAAHGAALWGSEQVMLPSLDVAPPITMWRRNDIAIDGFHHLVYVAATGLSYELLSARS
jgi:hypothetical protein